MRVVVFDIDGTLTQTTRVDGRFFKDALRAVFGDVELGSLTDCADVTDTGILREVCAKHSDREYAAVEAEVYARFLSGLETAVKKEPEAFAPVSGAREVFSAVRSAGWIPAIATGGWRRSAELKLEVARIPTEGVPLATSSEAARRVDIIRRAVAEASSGAQSEVVYVGDGTWDVRACRELQIGFIGRAAPGSEARLVAEGAKTVVADFSDPAELLARLANPSALRPVGP